MRASIRLGRWFGIEVGLHYSWFLIAFLIVMSLSAEFTQAHREWGQAAIWGVSIITAILFFVTLLAHEMSHALVARTRGLTTRSITLFALGGVASIENEPRDPKTEFWVGIAGPISSAIIGLICLGIALAAGWTREALPGSPVIAGLVWLGYINLVLAAFNMIPGYPLDGGRILRSIIWWVTKNQVRSTQLAARVGQVVAIVFIAFGVFRFFTGGGFGGLWLAFIGWFLLQAAAASRAQVELMAELKGVRVSDIMARDCAVISGNTSIEQFVDDYLVRSGRRCFVVEGEHHIEGLVTPREIKSIERDRWRSTVLADIMRPLDELHTVSPATPVAEALETMGREDVNQLPVVSDHRLEGVLSRANVIAFLQNRAKPLT